jgi:hypothetical protein
MKVVCCVKGELLSIIGLYGKNNEKGLKDGGLPCGECQQDEFACL